ncbi:Vps51/Vps67-domain-containing protein [Talaromyces proteolyticus]|uniref:Vacuolar protein sorting-associated protein 51 homolog n=1 Tax=Talaromyces proteolyticus TaxID=1131652 RepID=A0AAD4PTW1_9EURO|nr:Vps51/Vps67-domain-containing protein [Talaromyces proteolyticus]KAH8693968.1 Vps51/Vps67-domain-containing protein [Talaromyces proteolyticus]
MSTISSPRLSITSSRATPTSSRRPSIENLTPNNNVSGLGISNAASSKRAVSPAHRRNRAALRDYYNIKSDGGNTPVSPSGAPRSTGANELSGLPMATVSSELDGPGFNAQQYIDQLLNTSSLSTVLKAENTLVGDIGTLDGERKALVYDNYSKLIRAVETIGTMRRSMEERGAPLTMTKTLGPAVAFVAETASGLIKEGEDLRRRVQEAKSKAIGNKSAEQSTVEWALGTPDRLRKYLSEDNKAEAQKDWTEIDGLLSSWKDVKGVAELRAACEEIMKDFRKDSTE